MAQSAEALKYTDCISPYKCPGYDGGAPVIL